MPQCTINDFNKNYYLEQFLVYKLFIVVGACRLMDNAIGNEYSNPSSNPG